MSQPLDRMDLFGGLKTADDWKDEMASESFGADDIDDDLDALEAEMFGEDGPDPDAMLAIREAQAENVARQMDVRGQLTIPPGMRASVDALEGAFAADVLLPNAADGGTIESVLEFVSENMANDDDTREMADYLATFVSNVGKPWSALNDAEKAGMVKAAIYQAAIPGMEQGWDDRLYEGFNALLEGEPLDALGDFAMVPVEGLQDSARAALDIIDMIKLPWIGDALTPAFAEVADEQVNTLAILYVALDKAGVDVVDWIVQEIDDDIGDVVPETVTFEDEGPDIPAIRLDEDEPTEQIEAYVQTSYIYEVAPPESEGIRPQDVLAMGYAGITIGALAGLIK